LGEYHGDQSSEVRTAQAEGSHLGLRACELLVLIPENPACAARLLCAYDRLLKSELVPAACPPARQPRQSPEHPVIASELAARSGELACRLPDRQRGMDAS
jgi:hypothetical protein